MKIIISESQYENFLEDRPLEVNDIEDKFLNGEIDWEDPEFIIDGETFCHDRDRMTNINLEKLSKNGECEITLCNAHKGRGMKTPFGSIKFIFKMDKKGVISPDRVEYKKPKKLDEAAKDVLPNLGWENIPSNVANVNNPKKKQLKYTGTYDSVGCIGENKKRGGESILMKFKEQYPDIDLQFTNDGAIIYNILTDEQAEKLFYLLRMSPNYKYFNLEKSYPHVVMGKSYPVIRFSVNKSVSESKHKEYGGLKWLESHQIPLSDEEVAYFRKHKVTWDKTDDGEVVIQKAKAKDEKDGEVYFAKTHRAWGVKPTKSEAVKMGKFIETTA